MKTIRLYQNTPFAEGMKVDLNNDNSHHLNKVLRFPVGKNIIVFNGDGVDYEAVVESAKRTTCINIISKNSNNTESKLDLTLAQGIAKGEKMDFLIQKAVELGVSRIIPMNLERCVVRLKREKIQKKIDHWQKIANHACEQSGRSVIVNVSQPASLDDLWLHCRVLCQEAGSFCLSACLVLLLAESQSVVPGWSEDDHNPDAIELITPELSALADDWWLQLDFYWVLMGMMNIKRMVALGRLSPNNTRRPASRGSMPNQAPRTWTAPISNSEKPKTMHPR